MLWFKSITIYSVAESSFGCGLEKSDRIELFSFKGLNNEFSDIEKVLVVGLLALVSLKCSKHEELLLATLREELFDEMVVSSKFNL